MSQAEETIGDRLEKIRKRGVRSFEDVAVLEYVWPESRYWGIRCYQTDGTVFSGLKREEPK